MTGKLRTMVVLGSTSHHSPPWGGPKRMGDRVAKYLLAKLKERTTIQHEIDFIDLREVKLPLLEQAHYWYAPGTAPKEMDEMAARIAKQDSFVLISPEYNHSMSPALANFLNHFAQSNYAYKPSLIATYSPGPFGGVRAAMSMRTFTGELGCLSVSPIFAAPEVHKSLDDDGHPIAPFGALLDQQSENCFKQLEWVADAFKKQRESASLPSKQQ